MNEISQEKWNTFSERDQIGNIASELIRAENNINSEQKQYVPLMLEKALYLIDLSLDDPKWKKNSLALLILRDKIASSYLGNFNELEEAIRCL